MSRTVTIKFESTDGTYQYSLFSVVKSKSNGRLILMLDEDARAWQVTDSPFATAAKYTRPHKAVIERREGMGSTASPSYAAGTRDSESEGGRR